LLHQHYFGIILLVQRAKTLSAWSTPLMIGKTLSLQQQLSLWGAFEMSVILKLITRLGTAASIHQFPKLLYELKRSNHPRRPVELFPSTLQSLLQTSLRFLPFGFACARDVMQCMMTFPWLLSPSMPLSSQNPPASFKNQLLRSLAGVRGKTLVHFTLFSSYSHQTISIFLSAASNNNDNNKRK
jgi:hypothetical protein